MTIEADPDYRDKYEANIVVSIIVLAFNEEKFIAETLQSITEFKYGFPLEICVVDDQSTDNTAAIVTEAAAMDGRIRLLSNPRKGKVSAMNYGFANIQGDVVVLFSGDDRFNPLALADRVQPLLDLPADMTGISFAKLITFSEDPKMDGVVFPRFGGGARAGGAIAMNRALLNLIWPIPEQLPNEDTWLCLGGDYLADRVFEIDKPAGFYRFHSENTSSPVAGFETKHRAIADRAVVYKLFLEKFSASLDSKSCTKLQREVTAHAAFERKSVFGVARVRGYPLMRKIRLMMLSSALLYAVRMRFYGFFSGRVR